MGNENNFGNFVLKKDNESLLSILDGFRLWHMA
jgi:hypothetical protein